MAPTNSGSSPEGRHRKGLVGGLVRTSFLSRRHNPKEAIRWVGTGKERPEKAYCARGHKNQCKTTSMRQRGSSLKQRGASCRKRKSASLYSERERMCVCSAIRSYCLGPRLGIGGLAFGSLITETAAESELNVTFARHLVAQCSF